MEKHRPSNGSFPLNWSPFVRHRDRWDLVERIRTFVFLCTLLPLRICSIVLLLLWYYFSLRIGLFSFKSRIKPSELSTFKKKFVESAQPVARLFLFIIGFYRIEKKGDYRMSDSHGHANIMVMNHTSYIDILLIMAVNWGGIPSFVAKKEVVGIPIIGYKSQVWQCIYVDRMGSSARVGLSKLIGDRGGDPSLKPVVVFSEGTTTNGQFVITFHSGAFVFGHPVKPVAIRYPCTGGFSATWETIPAWYHILRLMTQWRNYVEVTWLPIYHPSEEEKADSKLYANNVRKRIADTLRVPTLDASYIDKVQYHQSLKLVKNKAD